MASQSNLTLHEGNDETVAVVLTADGAVNLGEVTALEFVMKPSTCESDDDDNAVRLDSGVGGGITITTQTADTITATIAIPATALTETYERAWRLDALTGTARRTALYGSVTVLDL
jgi:DNA-binding beta-propeller fold protein YncE